MKITFQITFQVTQIVRFLLANSERGLRFRNLGFFGRGLMWTVTFNAPVPIYPEGLAFFPPFLEGHGASAFVSAVTRIRILNPIFRFRVPSASRDLNRRFSGLQVAPRLRFACYRRRYRGASCS